MLTGSILRKPKKPRQVPIFLGALTFFGMFFGTIILAFRLGPSLNIVGTNRSEALQLLVCFCMGLSFLLMEWLKPFLGVNSPTSVTVGIMVLPVIIYFILLHCFIFVRRWISYALLCVILGCVLFANMAGCRDVWKGLSGIQ
jgi:apolipoprotein N-acyltransferase